MTTALERVYAVLFDNPHPADACILSISNTITNYTARHQLHTDSVRLKRVHDQLQDALHPAGIFGVPTYIIGSERFFGREHLPMVRWILEGRPGAKPDIAYQHFPEKIT